MRFLAVAILALAALFCALGMTAKFEPPEAALPWRIGYGSALVVALVLIVVLLRRRRRK